MRERAGMYVVGVDVGTGSARAGVFSLVDGARVGMSSTPIRMSRPAPDFVEQSSTDIWDAVGASVRGAVSDAGVDPGAVVGIGFDATCSLVLLDAADRPVSVSPTRDGLPGDDFWNVLVWMDHRAVSQADSINAGGFDVLKYVGGAVSPEMELPKLAWLKENAPDAWARAVRFLDLADFLTYFATGIDTRSLCTHVCKWNYLGHEGRYDTAFLSAIGLDDPRIVDLNIRPLGERIGPLTERAASHLGLTTGCRVGVGIIDAHAGGLGLLGLHSGAPEAAIALIGGTSNCHMAASQKPIFVPGVWGPYFGAMVPGLWLTEGGQSAAGSLIDFSIETGAGYDERKTRADAVGKTVYEQLGDELAALADGGDPTTLARDGHILDYHLGNRSPFSDPYARGVVSGLTLDRSPQSGALSYLATVQAVAYGTRAIVDAMNDAGFRIERLLATGGGTKNPLWLQQHADATGLSITLGAESESVLLGAAILGANASGAFESVSSAMSALAKPGVTIEPDPKNRAFHDAKYAVYRDLYESQKRHRSIMADV